MWIVISKKLYRAIYDELKEKLVVFGAYTNLENTSRFDAGILTEWGFQKADEPLIRCVSAPESQTDIPEDSRKWNHKYYIWKQKGDE